MGKISHKANKILLIDDAQELVAALKGLLEADGFRVEIAYNGREGLDVLKTYTPDLIILDMEMPKMGGIEFYHHIVNLETGKSRYPVLVFTGRNRMKDLFEDFDVDGFIAKPFDFDELLQVIHGIFKKRYSDPEEAAKARAAEAASKEAAPAVMIFDEGRQFFDEMVVHFTNAGFHVVPGLGVSSKIDPETAKLAYAKIRSENPAVILFKVRSLNPLEDEFMVIRPLLPLMIEMKIPLMVFGGDHLVIYESVAFEMCKTPGMHKVLPTANPDKLLAEVRAALAARKG